LPRQQECGGFGLWAAASGSCRDTADPSMAFYGANRDRTGDLLLAKRVDRGAAMPGRANDHGRFGRSPIDDRRCGSEQIREVPSTYRALAPKSDYSFSRVVGDLGSMWWPVRVRGTPRAPLGRARLFAQWRRRLAARADVSTSEQRSHTRMYRVGLSASGDATPRGRWICALRAPTAEVSRRRAPRGSAGGGPLAPWYRL
jgi:hypothetical protein